MGVKDFTKVFAPIKEVKFTEFSGKSIVVDASIELHRAALALSPAHALTDSEGNPTHHINVLLLGVILKLKGAGIRQYWVFDHIQSADSVNFHNELKQREIIKRKEFKDKAKAKLEELKKQRTEEEELFSDEDEELTSKINSQEKASFKMKTFYRNDLIFMLNCLDIPWTESPAGFEAEQICALSTVSEIFDVKVDYVLSSDADTLLFGAKAMIKHNTRTKKFYLYRLETILKDYKLTKENFVKICLILGTDFADKTPRIGPKTVLKKYETVQLSEAQEKAYENIISFKLDSAPKIYNNAENSFTSVKKYEELLDWLESKQYNRQRIIKAFKNFISAE